MFGNKEKSTLKNFKKFSYSSLIHNENVGVVELVWWMNTENLDLSAIKNVTVAMVTPYQHRQEGSCPLLYQKVKVILQSLAMVQDGKFASSICSCYIIIHVTVGSHLNRNCYNSSDLLD